MYSVTEQTSIGGFIFNGKYMETNFFTSEGFCCVEDASRFASNKTSFRVWVYESGNEPSSLLEAIKKEKLARVNEEAKLIDKLQGLND
jgi:hypothetical protein